MENDTKAPEVMAVSIMLLQSDIRTLELMEVALEALSQPKARPLQTPEIRDHLLLALSNVTLAADYYRELVRNAGKRPPAATRAVS